MTNSFNLQQFPKWNIKNKLIILKDYGTYIFKLFIMMIKAVDEASRY